jgi:hypothetical protein
MVSAVAAQESDYVIGVDDVLQIIVWGNKELEQQVSVRPDGKISFPLAGELKAAGLTVPQLADALTSKLADSVKNANVSVMVKEIRSYRVYLLGQVPTPGVYPIKAGTPLGDQQDEGEDGRGLSDSSPMDSSAAARADWVLAGWSRHHSAAGWVAGGDEVTTERLSRGPGSRALSSPSRGGRPGRRPHPGPHRGLRPRLQRIPALPPRS